MRRLSALTWILFLAAVARAEDPTAEALRAFAYEPVKFETKFEKRLERDKWTQYKVEFPSPTVTDTESNNTVHGHLVVPKGKWTAAVIVLPIWKGGGPNLELMVARRLAEDGVAGFVMALPYQFERSPEGKRSGALTVSSDLERTRQSVIQAIRDVRRSAQWLVEDRGADPKRLGIMGISLGGHIAALAWAVEPKFHAAVTVLAGGNIHELFWNESDETKEIKEELQAKGVTLEQLATLMKPYDAVTYATKERKQGLLLIGSKDDPVVPIRNVRALRDAFGGPRLIVFPGNHYSVIVAMGDILGDVSAHFRKELLDSE
ncbi:MAG: alpha/beta hydrolase family protein [Planctomycetes bacterium]|nr:alpha/beta hydrolase family protein [Planctomycetota bacterium]